MSTSSPNLNKTLTDIVYLKIRDDIIHGSLLPGSKLKIEPLRKMYEIGASPIREALSRLCSDGFVTIKGQQGFNVMKMSKDDLKDVTNTRVLIENKALEMSILHGDDEWESSVVAAFHRLSKTEHSDDKPECGVLEKLNKTFHDSLISACDSKILLDFYSILYDKHKRYRNLAREAHHVKRNIHEEHSVIYEAALAKDVDAAIEANERHIRNTEDAVILIRKNEWV